MRGTTGCSEKAEPLSVRNEADNERAMSRSFIGVIMATMVQVRALKIVLDIDGALFAS